ncbi:MAG: hypothetical protein JWM10_3723 [Myxococcaceae bacterium]|nr:hypothetical protein [Myxococcaceae bacterium]
MSLSCPCDAATTERAISLLRAVDEGTPTREPARALAIAVLKQADPDSQAWARAVAVLEGGPLRARHAVDLAGDVVDAAGDVSFSDGAPDVRVRGNQ